MTLLVRTIIRSVSTIILLVSTTILPVSIIILIVCTFIKPKRGDLAHDEDEGQLQPTNTIRVLD